MPPRFCYLLYSCTLLISWSKCVISWLIAFATSPRLASEALLFARASERWSNTSAWIVVARSSIVNWMPVSGLGVAILVSLCAGLRICIIAWWIMMSSIICVCGLLDVHCARS